MTVTRAAFWMTLILSFSVRQRDLFAEEEHCNEIHAMALMATAKSVASLTDLKPKAGDSYRARIVFSFRLFELSGSSKDAAAVLLNLIPSDKEHDFVWHSFGQLLSCQSESEADMETLGRLQIRLPGDLARAVLLVPDRMPDYVAYANTSCGYPDSDYAVQMQKVCRARHEEFLRAVDHLSPDAKKWFLTSTFNPGGCHALHFPEQ